jgi:tetratricopeptide (TPR) repeat protein
LNSAVEKHPDEKIIKYERASTLLHLGRVREALREVEAALLHEPRSSELHLILAQCLLRMKEIPKAKEAIENASKLNRKNPELHYLRGLIAINNADWNQALSELNESLWLEPQHSPSFLARGQIHLALNEAEKALNDFGRAAEYSRYDPSPLKHRIELLVAKQEWKKATFDAERWVELEPINPSSWMQLGILQLNLHEECKAIEALFNAGRLNGEISAELRKVILTHGDRFTDSENAAKWWYLAADRMRLIHDKNTPQRERFERALSLAAKEPLARLRAGILRKCFDNRD